MISYGQNAEDVVLARALGHIESGFYVDIGAWDPIVDSCTAHFYKSGWQGINVEPNPELLVNLKASRPRDINLEVAAGREAGVEKLQILENSGLSTLRRDVAECHISNNVCGFDRELDVTVLPLDDIFRKHLEPTQTIHFLKIDSEGTEYDVISGTQLHDFRPWVIVVEATEPMSSCPSHRLWEPLLLERGYARALFDGLNRFYVADEHRELLKALSSPASVFDDFVTHREYKLGRQLLMPEIEPAEAPADNLATRITRTNRRNLVLAADLLEERVDELRISNHGCRERARRLEVLHRQSEARLAQLSVECAALHQHVQALSQQISVANEEQLQLEAMHAATRQRLAEIENSISWRGTAAARYAFGAFLAFAKHARSNFRFWSEDALDYFLRRLTPGLSRLLLPFPRFRAWGNSRIAAFRARKSNGRVLRLSAQCVADENPIIPEVVIRSRSIIEACWIEGNREHRQ